MFSTCSSKEVAASMPLKMTYFPLFAKGPSVALALEMSGLNWEGSFPENWKEEKASTPWGALPILEIPGLFTIGHEVAILNFIGREAPALAGASKKDFLASQQLLCEAEDIYKALQAKQDTILQKEKVSQEVSDKFWAEPEHGVHNKEFGVHKYLELVEAFHKTCGGKDGRFTETGRTVGEIKLFVTLRILSLIKDDVLAKYEGLSAFYNRFLEEKETKALLESGCQMPGPFPQGYIANVRSAGKAAEGGA